MAGVCRIVWININVTMALERRTPDARPQRGRDGAPCDVRNKYARRAQGPEIPLSTLR